jgi:hypothetical protein
LRGFFVFGEKEGKGFYTENTEYAEGAEKREGGRSQRGRGKTRRLRLPGMITAMEWPSGVMAKSRKLRP